MSDADFYNLNLYRHYPLVDERYTFTSDALGSTELIVDAGFVFFENSGFQPDNPDHRVYFSGQGTSSGNPAVLIYVRCPGAPVAGEYSCRAYMPQDFSFAKVSFTQGGTVFGFGWVVIGKLNAFALGAPVSSSASISSSPDAYRYAERRCIQTFKGHYVNKFIVANSPRVVAPGGPAPGPSGLYEVAPRGSNIIGDVKFKEGYNCSITPLPRNNAIRFSAIRGDGLGETCEEIPKTSYEEYLDDNGYPLDNAVRCHQVMTNVNGIPPNANGEFTLSPGNGITVDMSAPNIIRIIGNISIRYCGNNS